LFVFLEKVEHFVVEFSLLTSASRETCKLWDYRSYFLGIAF
jgi:hypothetical protein